MAKHAIITGGSSGIGKSVAIKLAAQGYDIGILARSEDKLVTAVEEIKSAAKNDSQQIYYKVSDVSNNADVTAAIQACIKEHGAPDLLITSAGIAVPGYFEELPIENFEKTMQVNYFGTIYPIKAALPAMKEKKSGHIVVVSSGAAFTGIFGYTSYGASKFALRGFAEALRCEMKPHGLDVSIVYPPDTDTPQLHEENKTKPAETKAISGNAKALTAEQVADCVIKGIAKKKFGIAPGFEMKLLMRINSIFAGALYWYFDGVVKKTRKKLGK